MYMVITKADKKIAVTSVAREHLKNLFQHRVPLCDLSASKKLNSKYKVSVGGNKYHIHIGKATYHSVDNASIKGDVDMPAGKPWTLHLVNGRQAQFDFPQAHVHVMRRIDERCPGSAPQIGERVWYVYGEVQNAVLQYEKAEDLGFATETDGFRADVVYYYEHSVRNALESIFEIFNANPAVLFEDLLRNARNKRNRQSEISSFFTSVTKS